MAARSSAGVGMVITVVLLGVLSLGLFISTVMLFGQNRARGTELVDLQGQFDDFASRSERDNTTVQQWRQLADAEGMSLVGYLMASYNDATSASIGSRDMTPEQFDQQLERLSDEGGSSLASTIAGLERSVNTLEDQNRRLQAENASANQEVQTSQQRLAAQAERHAAAIDTLESDIQRYSAEVANYRDRVLNIEASFEEEIRRVRSDAQSAQEELSLRVNEKVTENIILREQLVRLRGESDEDLSPRAEESLVDGEILGRNTVSNTVELSVGRRDRVQLGMSFSVYATANEVRIDPVTREYSLPKGVVEIIRVDEATSTARVLRSQQGNPIVRGDIIVNPVYDPDKIYQFVVFGLFDTNGDGQSTAQERDGLDALIQSWGGRLAGDVDGSVDFVVLGRRPSLPPEPQSGDPPAVIQEYIRQRNLVNRYDELFERAEATAIPVLNENRLYTLLGKRPGQTR